MKNSIFALATVAFSAVFGLSSCDKNDDSMYSEMVMIPEAVHPNDPSPKTPVDTYLYAVVTDDQLGFVGATYSLSVDGVTKVIKQSDMSVVKDAQRLSEAQSLIDKYEEFPPFKNDIKILEFHVGNAKEVKIESITYNALYAMSDHMINMCSGAQVKSGMNVISEVNLEYHHGFTEVAEMVDLLNEL